MVRRNSEGRLMQGRPRPSARMATLPRGGRVRSRMIALTLAVGLVVPGALVALTPSTAGAAGSDPLGPTIAQLEATYAVTVANAESVLPAVYYPLYDELAFIDSYCFPTITRYCPL
jgi:hypothetical protein